MTIDGRVEYQEVVKHSVIDIYGKTDVLIPSGFEYVNFRLPKDGEKFINKIDSSKVEDYITYTTIRGPRIIVKEKKEIVFIQKIKTISLEKFVATKEKNGLFLFFSLNTSDIGYWGSQPSLFAEALVLEEKVKRFYPDHVIKYV